MAGGRSGQVFGFSNRWYRNKIRKKEKRMIFGDIETTGLDPLRNEILTGSFISSNGQEKLKEIDLKFRPRFPKKWSIEAEAVHKISLDEAMTFPRHEESMDELMGFINGHSSFVCHALPLFGQHFDWAFIKVAAFDMGYWYNLQKSIREDRVNSTITLAKKKITLPDYKLNTLCKHFGIELDHHNAKSDVNACFEIYRKLNN
jgi:DNA polymerase-3 subunit epsilon